MVLRLAPSLSTAKAKADFIHSFHISRTHHLHHQQHITKRILSLFGEGNPSKIVHMACESTAESVERLVEAGRRILKDYPGHHG